MVKIASEFQCGNYDFLCSASESSFNTDSNLLPQVESYQKYVERALSNRHSRVFEAPVLPTEMEETLAPVSLAAAEATPAEHRRFVTVTKAQVNY